MKEKKLPRLFRRSYKAKALDRKIYKRIYIPKDLELVKSLFGEDSDGFWSISTEIDGETRKKLKTLAKSIKKNKGIFTTWKVALFLIPLLLVLVFSFLFKNSLAEKGLERALESVFQAQVDLQDLDISLLKGEISFRSLIVADKDTPGFNLFETGDGIINISTGELAFKRFYVEELSLKELQWNTPGDNSDQLIPDEINDREEEATASRESGFALSPEELIESVDLNQLPSYQVIEESNQKIRDLKEKWTDRFDDKKKEVEAFEADVETIRNLDSRSLTDPREIAALIEQISSSKDRIGNLTDSVKTLGDDFKADKKEILDMTGSFTTTIDRDIDSLRDKLNFSEGGFQSLASEIAESYIRSRWNRYYEAGMKIWNLYKKTGLSSGKEEDSEPEGISRSPGRTVPFYSPVKPRFFIDRMILTGIIEEESRFEAEILSISNEPEKVENPLTFNGRFLSGGIELAAEGILDMRETDDIGFSLNISGEGMPVSLSDGISFLSVDSFDSEAELQGVVSTSQSGEGLSSTFSVFLDEIQIERDGNDSFIGRTAESILEDLQEVELEGSMVIDSNGIGDLKIDTDLDDILSDGLGNALLDIQEQAIDGLEAALLDQLGPLLDENDLLNSDLIDLENTSLDQLASLADLESSLDSKKDELENMADNIGSSLLKQAADTIKLPGF